VRGATRGNDKICFAKYDHKEAPRLGPSRRTNGGRHLGVGEKIQIVHEVIVQHQLQKEVAAAHQVTAATVCILCKKANKNKEFLKDMMNLREEKGRRRQVIQEKVTEMNQLNVFVDSAAFVQKELLKDKELLATEQEITKVMREDLGMRYKKLVPISIHGNSAKNLVLRQQFATHMIRLLQEGKRVLNLDESWVGMGDFRRRKWRALGTTNSVAQLPIVPRISMIMALDSHGEVYLSLLQANSNGSVMDIFFRQLVLQLDRERPQWRQDTVILMDNAKYHWSKSTTKMLKSLAVPVLYTGPHSYAASPCELWFAAFKSCDVNPRKVSTGKR
jgi:hypothetical protein